MTAAFFERCGVCGRFLKIHAPGVSWCAGGEFGEEIFYRCSPCTDRYGIRQSSGNPASGPWQGRNSSATRPPLDGGAE